MTDGGAWRDTTPIRPAEVARRWEVLTAGATWFQTLAAAIGEPGGLDRLREDLDGFEPSLLPDPAQLVVARAMLICAELAVLVERVAPRNGMSLAAEGRDEAALATLARLLQGVDPTMAVPAGISPVSSTLDRRHWLAFVRHCLQATAWPSPLGPQAAWDLLLRFGNGARPVGATERLQALLVVKEYGTDAGRAAILTLESLSDPVKFQAGDQDGVLYPDPTTMAFTPREEAFQGAERAAVGAVGRTGLWASGHDVRWSLAFHDGSRYTLEGASMGAALALGLSRLASQLRAASIVVGTEASKLDLGGVAVTAMVTPDGALAPIGSLFEKLFAAARERSIPRVHTVVIAAGQDFDAPGLEPVKDEWGVPAPNILADPQAEFRVLRAATVDTARDRLELDASTRFRVDCTLPPAPEHYTGRARLAETLRRFIDTHESGYLVIVGGVGQGKSTFLAQAVREEGRRRGEPIAYHVVMDEDSAPHTVAECLYARLRRKWAFREPPEWKDTAPDQRLAQLLGELSQHELTNGRKEVLFIDAADQTAASALKPLLPGTLRAGLPRGVLCVITSRLRLDWLRQSAGVTAWDWDDHADDRADVGAYMRTRACSVEPALEDAFIDRVLARPEPPVFFTVAGNFDELSNPDSAAELGAKALDPAWWTRPAEQKIEDDARWALARAAESGIDEDAFWATLGSLALAFGRGFSEDDLRRLGLWNSTTGSMLKLAANLFWATLGSLALTFGRNLSETDLRQSGPWKGSTRRVLALAANFFRRRPALAQPNLPYVFSHPGYRRFVLARLGEHSTLPDLNRRIARGCDRVLSGAGAGDPLRDYALRHRLAHLIRGRAWPSVAKAFADARQIEERGRRFGFFEIYADARAVSSHPNLPVDTRSTLFEWERFLRFRVKHLQTMPETYAQEVTNEFLPKEATPIAMLLSRARGPDQSVRARKERGLLAIAGNSGHQEAIRCLAFSWDGTRVASVSDRTVKVWHVETGRLVANCCDSEDVVSVALSPDGTRLVSASWDSVVRVWNAETGQPVVDCEGAQSAASLAFSANGTRGAAGTFQDTVIVWDPETGQLLEQHDTCAIYNVRFSPDGTRVLGSIAEHDPCSADGTRTAFALGGDAVEVKDVEAGRRVKCQGHAGAVTCVAISPDGTRVASGSHDRTVRVWNATTGELVFDCHGSLHAKFTAVSADCTRVASGLCEDDTVKVWDAETGRLVASCRDPRGFTSAAAISPDGARVAFGSGYGYVKVWDAVTDQLVALCRGTYAVWSLAFSPDGAFVASGHDDGTLKVWNAGTGQPVAPGPRHLRRVVSVGFSPDSAFVASGDSDGTLKVWNAKNGQLLAGWQGHSGPVRGLAFSPDGRRIASGSDDWIVKVWHVGTGQLAAVCLGHSNGVNNVAFSPDGTRIASGSDDSSVRLWVVPATSDRQPGEIEVQCSTALFYEHSVGAVAFVGADQLLVADRMGRTSAYQLETW